MADRNTQLARRGGDVMRFDPWNELNDMRRSMDEMFSRFFGPTPGRFLDTALPKAWSNWQPNIDLYETEDEFVFRADLPGYNQEDIDVRLTADTLSINARHSEESTSSPQPQGGNGAPVQGNGNGNGSQNSAPPGGQGDAAPAQGGSQAVQRSEPHFPRTYHVQNRQRQSFAVTYTLPGEIDPDRAEAAYRNGVLELHLPKREEAKPKQVQVQVRS
jgi:HSP20 family protein